MPDLEALAVTACLALVTLPLAIAVWRRAPRPAGVAAFSFWLLGSAAMGWAAVDYAPAHKTPVTNRPIEVLTDGYVSSSACQSCHPGEYGSWYDSFHRTMTQVATSETMLAPWPTDEPRHFQFDDREYLIQERDGGYWVEMDDPDFDSEYGVPDRVWREVVQITGAHHWQFYWYATGHSRKLHLFPFGYRVVDNPRWMTLDACCVTPPSNRQATGIGRWSISCNKCHATHARPRVHGPKEMDTHAVELGIACEACHGPGGEHVEVNGDPQRRYSMHLSDASDETIVNPAQLDHVRSSMVCGNCHGITRFKSDEDRMNWGENGYRFRPGDLVSDTRQFDIAGEDKFWSDGVIRVSGREFNGLMRTPCYIDGEMSCLSCHLMHPGDDDPRTTEEWRDDQLHPGMRGNLACTQCHEEYNDESVLSAHTHHAPDSSGSTCYDCHMPFTTYGLLKGIRSHEVHNPSVAASVETGRPNGCNQCHVEKSLAWTAEHLEDWYGIEPPELAEDEQHISATVIWALRGDAGQRALAAWTMGQDEPRRIAGSTEWMTPLLALLLQDPYHAVRYIAQQSLERQRGMEEVLSQYDFGLPIEQRRSGSFAVYEAWKRRAARNPLPAQPELLIGPDGQLIESIMMRLLQEQDVTPLTLNE